MADAAASLRHRVRQAQQGLDLWSKDIGPSGAATLAAALVEPACALRRLDVSSNGVGDEGAAALAAALPHCSLRSLDLSGNDIGDQGAAALAGAIRHEACTLQSLGLEVNPVGAVGAAAFADAVAARAGTSRLRELRGCGEAASELLAEAATTRRAPAREVAAAAGEGRTERGSA